MALPLFFVLVCSMGMILYLDWKGMALKTLLQTKGLWLIFLIMALILASVGMFLGGRHVEPVLFFLLLCSIGIILYLAWRIVKMETPLRTKALLLIPLVAAFILGPIWIYIILWMGSIIFALILISKSEINDVAKVLWVLPLVFAPLIGAIAFYIVNPCSVDYRNELQKFFPKPENMPPVTDETINDPR